MTPESETDETCQFCGEALIPAVMFVYHHCPSCRVLLDPKTKKVITWLIDYKHPRGRLRAVRVRQ